MVDANAKLFSLQQAIIQLVEMSEALPENPVADQKRRASNYDKLNAMEDLLSALRNGKIQAWGNCNGVRREIESQLWPHYPSAPVPAEPKMDAENSTIAVEENPLQQPDSIDWNNSTLRTRTPDGEFIECVDVEVSLATISTSDQKQIGSTRSGLSLSIMNIAERWIAGYEAHPPIGVESLAIDLVDVVLNGTTLQPFHRDGRPTSGHDLAFELYAADDTSEADYEKRLHLAKDVLITADSLEQWRQTPEFAVWTKDRGLRPPKTFFVGDTGFHLTKGHAKKGGSRSKHNEALQKAINIIQAEILATGKKLTASTFKEWFREQRARSWKEYSSEVTPYSFVPPIPDCDELYIDGKKLVWKDQEGKWRDCSLRSLERYFRKANAQS